MNYQRRTRLGASSNFYVGCFFGFLDLKTLFKNIGQIVWTEDLYLCCWSGFPSGKPTTKAFCMYDILLDQRLIINGFIIFLILCYYFIIFIF
jgi:hypothetical protein